MEYFIVEPGEMWDAILAVLREKAAAGVEVRFLYDGLGSIMTAPAGYDRTLRQMGIRARRFNPFIPVVSSRFNNRDHRKICVVDGHTGFTGGINPVSYTHLDVYKRQVLAEPVLGDKLLHAGHLPVDTAGLRDAALGVDVRDHVFGHGLVG